MADAFWIAVDREGHLGSFDGPPPDGAFADKHPGTVVGFREFPFTYDVLPGEHHVVGTAERVFDLVMVSPRVDAFAALGELGYPIDTVSGSGRYVPAQSPQQFADLHAAGNCAACWHDDSRVQDRPPEPGSEFGIVFYRKDGADYRRVTIPSRFAHFDDVRLESAQAVCGKLFHGSFREAARIKIELGSLRGIAIGAPLVCATCAKLDKPRRSAEPESYDAAIDRIFSESEAKQRQKIWRAAWKLGAPQQPKRPKR